MITPPLQTPGPADTLFVASDRQRPALLAQMGTPLNPLSTLSERLISSLRKAQRLTSLKKEADSQAKVFIVLGTFR